jgi:hypothetical protein
MDRRYVIHVIAMYREFNLGGGNGASSHDATLHIAAGIERTGYDVVKYVEGKAVNATDAETHRRTSGPERQLRVDAVREAAVAAPCRFQPGRTLWCSQPSSPQAVR